MNSRHKARETALQILYRFDGAEKPSSSPIKPVGYEPASPASMLKELNNHFSHFQTPEGIREFAALLVAGTVREMTEIDELIETHAANWKVSRMALVDRSLLRMATYELKNVADTPSSVVIDEAIELAKQFGNAESPAFVNGILDAIKSKVRQDE